MRAPGPRFRRYALYGVALLLAVLVDRFTPLGMADWMAEASIVWISTVWGTVQEMRTVALVASAAMLLGFWLSPNPYIPVWVDLANRMMIIGIVWIVVHASSLRLAAQEAALRASVQVKVLQGLLPICACCKSIRSETGEWHKLERYLSANSDVSFTHTYCPPCAEKLYPKAEEAAQPH